ncbi:hypothetical protein QJS04_geneDACA023252 [Acorus gramineus]|uniref:RNase H type-1 domain-containing protein n=1 Tax=Acorus gramineus TaxID=55184 RepID=A0AAV9A5P1_ACOGR|nr:hypothetical protein QJS04_geneDACA023252 [Acorus gramineus]
MVYTVWSIWKSRNDKIFRNSSTPKSFLVNRIIRATSSRFLGTLLPDNGSSLSQVCSKAFGIPLVESLSTSQIALWLPPSAGWVKINSDGSKGDDRFGYGAIVRDPNGDCLVAVAVRSCAASINILELQGMAYGLKLCTGLPNSNKLSIWAETDSTTVVAWTQGRGTIPWFAFRDLRFIKQTLAQFASWRVSHIFREGNRVADFLAAARSSLGSTIYAPSLLGSDLQALIQDDKQSRSQLRISSKALGFI